MPSCTSGDLFIRIPIRQSALTGSLNPMITIARGAGGLKDADTDNGWIVTVTDRW